MKDYRIVERKGNMSGKSEYQIQIYMKPFLRKRGWYIAKCFGSDPPMDLTYSTPDKAKEVLEEITGDYNRTIIK